MIGSMELCKELFECMVKVVFVVMAHIAGVCV